MYLDSHPSNMQGAAKEQSEKYAYMNSPLLCSNERCVSFRAKHMWSVGCHTRTSGYLNVELWRYASQVEYVTCEGLYYYLEILTAWFFVAIVLFWCESVFPEGFSFHNTTVAGSVGITHVKFWGLNESDGIDSFFASLSFKVLLYVTSQEDAFHRILRIKKC